MSAGGFETESRIEVWVSDNDNERTVRSLKALVSRFDQLAPHTLALVFRRHGHQAQPRAFNLVHGQRAVHNMAKHAAIEGSDQ